VLFTQADDEVGKISSLTPLVVGAFADANNTQCVHTRRDAFSLSAYHARPDAGKAMELFLGTVVNKAVAVAKKRGTKTLSAAHLYVRQPPFYISRLAGTM
jgi:hypothetical protein